MLDAAGHMHVECCERLLDPPWSQNGFKTKTQIQQGTEDLLTALHFHRYVQSV